MSKNNAFRPPQTRRFTSRVTTACRQCKKRKSKCDGTRPTCENCQRQSQDCDYDTIDLRKARHTTNEFNALTNRILHLEKTVRSLIETQSSQPTSSQQSPPLNSFPIYENDINPHVKASATPQPPQVVHNYQHASPISAATNTEVNADDWLNPYLGGAYDIQDISLDWDDPFLQHDQDVYNETFDDSLLSNTELLTDVLDDTDDDWRLMQEVLAREAQTQTASLALDALTSSIAQLQISNSSGEPFYVGPTSNLHLMRKLPYHPRRQEFKSSCTSPNGTIIEYSIASQEQDNYLLNVYWSKVHSTFPVLGMYSDRSTAEEEMRQTPLLFNIVLAVGAFFAEEEFASRFGKGPADVITFYLERFTHLLGHEIDHCCLPNINTCLLRSYLEILKGNLESATIFHAIACAMAKRLGLHVNSRTQEVKSSALSPESEKARQSTFWACLWMDRRLSILEGRAVMIIHYDISALRPLEIIKRDATEYPTLPLSLELIYACQIEFGYIQDLALSKIYSFSSKPSSKDDATSEGHLRYVSWYASLPASVRDVKSRQSFHPTFLSFHMFFHAGIILLHRPSLKDQGRGAELANRQCRESAAEVTKFLQMYNTHFKDTVVDFMVIYSAFTAALVHLVLFLYPDVVTYRASLRSLKSTVKILSLMVPKSDYARIAYDDLKRLAAEWDISPASAPTFWPLEMEGSDTADSRESQQSFHSDM